MSVATTIQVPYEHHDVLVSAIKKTGLAFSFNKAPDKQLITANAPIDILLTDLHTIGECLLRHGVSYTFSHYSQNEFWWRRSSLRFDSYGTLTEREITPTNGYISVEELSKITCQLVNMPIKLAAIDQLLAKKRKELNFPSWDNQVEYGKRYLATQLLLT